MRKWLLFAFAVGLAASAGCATVTSTPEQDAANIRKALELDGRELAGDTNMIFMLDRPSRLTRWYVR